MIGAFAGDRRVGLYQVAALLTLAAAAAAVAALFGTDATVFSGTLAVDDFGGFAKLLIYAASFVCIAIAPRYFGPAMRAEYSALIVFARSEEHTSELQSLMRISYAVLCL